MLIHKNCKHYSKGFCTMMCYNVEPDGEDICGAFDPKK